MARDGDEGEPSAAVSRKRLARRSPQHDLRPSVCPTQKCYSHFCLLLWHGATDENKARHFARRPSTGKRREQATDFQPGSEARVHDTGFAPLCHLQFQLKASDGLLALQAFRNSFGGDSSVEILG
ncbi:hypothetical protein BU23DRAFT_651786 [Bimuria novae-zelandiae CBS 107.79]|uniref:Uncharacterized protein n=1 Tax=Bimuria novae-zelandiae CBS 107.79 TaxID=1447943 RepID=A0A6A5V1J2_9PLEO|nr:hypothetical protein BU23DRAFT_651786 [Bimuria novae-zelandiae CBS 107.79]